MSLLSLLQARCHKALPPPPSPSPAPRPPRCACPPAARPQGLLGQVACLSDAQEVLSAELAGLDGRIASLAAAIPAVQSINTGSRGGLYCWVRPLYRLAGVLGAGGRAGLALEVCLRNGGPWALSAGRHSLAVVLAPPGAAAAPGGHGGGGSRGTHTQAAEGQRPTLH